MSAVFKILPMVQVNPDQPHIDLEPIRDICSRGLDECAPEDRAIAWLVLSGTFSDNPSEWATYRTEMVAQYQAFISDFGLVDYDTKKFENTVNVTDFGLPDNHLMEIIHGDIVRSSLRILFFPEPELDEPVESDDDILNPFYKHLRRLERLLYIFGKLNPTCSYMQGFHELTINLYYAFSQAMPFFEGCWTQIECFTFLTFQQMYAQTQLGELYTTQDRSSIIHRRMAHFMDVLGQKMPDVRKTIQDHQIDPLFFAFRWLNILFSQEYEIPDLVIVWDALFAHFSEFIEYAIYIAVARTHMLKERIDAEDYIMTMTALQKGQVADVRGMLHLAKKYWDEDHRPKENSFFKRLFTK